MDDCCVSVIDVTNFRHGDKYNIFVKVKRIGCARGEHMLCNCSYIVTLM